MELPQNDLNFKKKLELSYQQCFKELINPPNWEEMVKCSKYEIDIETGHIKTYVEFKLSDDDDNIHDININHTYIFKRSHFYKNSNRLRSEIETVWNKRGYFVQLKSSENKWILKISWRY